MGDTLYQQWGNYTAIPNTVIEMIAEIGDGAFTLALYLRYRTNHQTNSAFPSYATIRKDTGFGRQKIADCLRRLESAGLLTRRKRLGSSTVYTLVLPRRGDTGSSKDKLQQFENQTTVVRKSNYSSSKIKLEPETINQKQLTTTTTPESGVVAAVFNPKTDIPSWKHLNTETCAKLEDAFVRYFGRPMTKSLRNGVVHTMAEEQVTAEQVVDALRLAAEKCNPSWRYALGILRNGGTNRRNGAQPPAAAADDGGIVVQAEWKGWTKINNTWEPDNRLLVLRQMCEGEKYEQAKARLAALMEREWLADWELQRKERCK